MRTDVDLGVKESGLVKPPVVETAEVLIGRARGGPQVASPRIRVQV